MTSGDKMSIDLTSIEKGSLLNLSSNFEGLLCFQQRRATCQVNQASSAPPEDYLSIINDYTGHNQYISITVD